MREYDLVHPGETLYFGLCLVVSVCVYLSLVASIVGLVYIPVLALIGFVGQGLFIGSIRGNGVRVTERQFPEVYRLTESLARQMGLERTPAVYVLEAGGFLNAFAARFLRRNFVIVYSDVLALAYEAGEDELAFVIAHELAHIRRGHLAWRSLLYPALLVPFLGQAYT
ncbi:MAG TPA: M48 family metallopeptidase, partial [Bacillota bacterium]